MAPCQAGNGRELLAGVDCAGRVVRAAEQICDPRVVAGQVRERLLEAVEVDAAFFSQRRLHDPAPRMSHEGVERRVHRAVHDHRIAGLADQAKDLDDAHHHVRDALGPVGREAVPAPALGGEVLESVGVGVSSGIPGVADPDGVLQHPRDRLGQRDVHLCHPHRQDVCGVVVPLGAGP